MVSARATFTAIALSAIAALSPCGAQQETLGRLLDVFDDATGQPVIGAEVVDLSTGTKALTSVSGAISLAFLEPGPTVLQIRKLGYKTRMLTVVVSPADSASITLTLLPLGQNLPTVVTSASAVPRKLESFEQRRQTGVGQFITTDQLDKAGDREMAGVMQLMAGPLIARSKSGGAAWIRCSSMACSSMAAKRKRCSSTSTVSRRERSQRSSTTAPRHRCRRSSTALA